MSINWKKLGLWGVALASTGLTVWGISITLPHWGIPKSYESVNIHDPALVARGEYLARVADCIACHTAPGGTPFAGGLGMQTPVGAIYSTNITPDPVTGIGHYSYGDFERAVRRGIRDDGSPLYPAMPYASYRIIRDEDVKALYAFFMSSVPAARKDNQPSTIPWPLSLRWPLTWWQQLFARDRNFRPPEDPELIRGAYLVEGLAHCGACHTPRGLAFEETALKEDPGGRYLSGSVLEGWYAKNLRNEATGLASWSEEEIISFLRTGRTTRTAAFGSMADVVTHSTQYLSDEDLQSIARYLKSLKARTGQAAEWIPAEDGTTARLRQGDFSEAGALSYIEHCATCHRLDGMGAPRIYPALKGNSMIMADDPSSLIQISLAGSTTPVTSSYPMALGMPAFETVKNAELAEILTFIRNSWGNRGSAVSAEQVGRMRLELQHRPVHHVPEAQSR